jgi:hypothetical protein
MHFERECYNKKVDIKKHVSELYPYEMLLLYGSRVRGLARPHSDWDFFGVVRGEETISRVFFVGDQMIELNLFPRDRILNTTDLLLNSPNDSFLTRLVGAEIIVAKDLPLAKTVVERAAKTYAEGPQHLTEESVNYTKLMLVKDFERLRTADPKSLYFDLKRSTFRAHLPRQILLLKKKWYRGLHDSLAELSPEESKLLKSEKLQDLESLISKFV